MSLAGVGGTLEAATAGTGRPAAGIRVTTRTGATLRP